MITRSTNYSENYAAKVVKLENPIKHPNADKLQGWNIDGNIVWTDMSRKVGDVCVFFPVECAINSGLLSTLNLYSSPEMNADATKKGFFGKHGRVRAIKLRGEPSMGFLLKWEEINEGISPVIDPFKIIYTVGEEFDTIGHIQLCWKYVPKSSTPTTGLSRKEKNQKGLQKISKLIPNQFRLHEDTIQLRKNIHKLAPDDIISITYKLHGTSFVVGNVLTKRNLTLPERIAKWLGLSVLTNTYDIIYSSRTRVKNEYHDNKGFGHFFGYDLWADVKTVLEPSIEKGITLYGEVVGYDRNGKIIQKGYDYGFLKPEDGECIEGINYGIYVYRITSTNVDGVKYEFTWGQIEEYCNLYGLRHVPRLYYGYAKDWHDAAINTEVHWHHNFLDALQEEYLEKDCTMCANKVPAEGVVVRVDKTFDFDAYKLKSFRFLEHETKELDKEEIDIETSQSVEETV
jgi:hypothetical protein